jgi:hypothetical protein
MNEMFIIYRLALFFSMIEGLWFMWSDHTESDNYE